jgi:hypothetical protein
MKQKLLMGEVKNPILDANLYLIEELKENFNKFLMT